MNIFKTLFTDTSDEKLFASEEWGNGSGSTVPIRRTLMVEDVFGFAREATL